MSHSKGRWFHSDIRADDPYRRQAESRVTAIEPIGELPLRVVFLVDISASQVGVSTDGRRRGIRQEAQRFYQEAIKLLPLRVSDSACLVAFNHRITVLQDFTSNKDLLMKSVSNLPPPIGPTRLLDALHLSNRALAVQGDSRRVVIVLTDGNDTSSSQAIEGVYKEAIDHNVRVYFIVSQRDSQRFSLFGRDIKKHEKFVKRTGGRALSFRDEKSMDKLITRIYDELEHLNESPSLPGTADTGSRNLGLTQRCASKSSFSDQIITTSTSVPFSRNQSCSCHPRCPLEEHIG